MEKWLKNNKGIVIVSLVYLLTFLLMLPLRNQAFEDDFAYIQTVDHLFETGKFKISDWASVTMVFQPFWGVLFYNILGPTIKSLHFSNVFLFYFGLIAFYFLLKRLKLGELRATIFTLLLLLYPWVFHFLYSFMSDVFYISLSIISLYFYIRGLQESSLLSLLLGSTFAGLAFLTRQIALVILIAMFLVLAYQNLVNRKIILTTFIYSLLPGSLIILLYLIWLNRVGLTAFQYITIGPNFKKQFISQIFPFRPGQVGATNTFYIEFLTQRVSGYLNVLMDHYFPFFLYFRLNQKQLLDY